MKKIVKMSLAVAMMSGLGAVSAQAADGMGVLNNVKVKGQIRPRYEGVNDGDSTTNNANAFTARTKLSINAGLLGVNGLTANLGIISVNNLGTTNFNSGANGHSNAANNKKYAKVVDPQDAMLSEAAINYTTGKVAAHVGRSTINLDNQRFIGTVGWRQLERSYDTSYLAYNDKKLSLLGAYIYGFAGVSGVRTTNTHSVILHAVYKVMPALKVTGYGYLIGSTSNTYGLALTGKVNAGAKFTYRAEYAVQKDPSIKTPGTPKAKVDGTYINLDLGANISGFLLGANYESLSGNTSSGANGFNPLLGTNHGFNGWADQFYVGKNSAPTEGLIDKNFRAGYKAKGFGKLLAVYHMFDAEAKSATFGSEIDAVYVNKIPGVKNLKGLVKYARYSADSSNTSTSATKLSRGNNDVTKMWLMLTYKF